MFIVYWWEIRVKTFRFVGINSCVLCVVVGNHVVVSWLGRKAAMRPSCYISHKDTKGTKGWPDRPLMGYTIVSKGGIIAKNGNKVLHVHCLKVGNKRKDVSIRGNKFLCSLCRGGKPCCCVVVGQESRYAAFLLYFPIRTPRHKKHEEKFDPFLQMEGWFRFAGIKFSVLCIVVGNDARAARLRNHQEYFIMFTTRPGIPPFSLRPRGHMGKAPRSAICFHGHRIPHAQSFFCHILFLHVQQALPYVR